MFAIAPTDIGWFQFLKENKHFNDVNFWTPTPWNITRLNSNDKFYFMLKSPIRKIGGFGIFKKYSNHNLNEAWALFGYGNGCASKEELIKRLDDYKAKNSQDKTSVANTEIGCISLSNVEFWEEDAYIDLAETNIDFSSNIVKLKYYTTEDFNTSVSTNEENGYILVDMDSEKLKKARMITDRKGQSNFKLLVSTAYNNKCCITGETIPELLEAAHIQPYINQTSNHVQNGILLRSDIHKLYDNNLIYIDESFIVHTSSMLQSNYYKQFHNKTISLPSDTIKYPSKDALKSRHDEFRK